MQVNILGEVYSFYNALNEVKNIIETISLKTTERNVIVSHYIIDGNEVYEPIENHLEARIENIQKVIVVTLTEKEYFLSTLLEINNYLERALPEIDKLVASFYNNEVNNKWIDFQQFIEGIQWILQVLKLNESNELLTNSGEEYCNIYSEIIEQSTNLLTGLESRDEILIADIMAYEIVPTLKKLKELMKSITMDR